MSVGKKADKVHYTFEMIEEDGVFKATEPNTGVDRWGVGTTPQEAIVDYCDGVGK